MITELFNPANYTFSPYAIPTFVTTVALLILGLTVLIRERLSLVSVLFFLMTLTVSVWLFGFSWMYSTTNESVARWWAKAAYLGVPFIPSAIYHFTVVALRIYQRYKARVLVSWTISALFAAVILPTDALHSALYRYPWGYYPKYGWLGLPFMTFFFCTMFIALHHYWMEYRKAKPGTHKSRIKWLSIAFAGAYIASLDFLPKYGVGLYPLGYLGVFAWLVFVERAIWRYQLVDITPAFAAEPIIRTMADPLLVLDHDGILQVTNQAACHLLGRSETELVGKSFSTISRDLFPKEKLDTLIRTGALQHYETNYSPRPGWTMVLDISASAIRDRFEQTVGIVCIARDITERKRAEETVRASEERFRSVTQSANDAIISADSRGVILSWNKGARAIFGYDEEEVRGQPLTLLMPERYREAHLQGLKRVQGTGESRVIGTTVELHGLRKDGGEFPLELSLATWKTWGQTFYSAVIRDITERKQAEARLAELAYYDFLTGLPNRRQFMELLDQALGRARRTGKLLAILFLDLDGFKLVNDSLGHPMGDLVLKTMATRLPSCVRKSDSVARMGGDEFMFILETITSPNDAVAVAQKLLETVALPMRLEGHDIFMTASIGIVIYPSDDQDRDGLIQYADTAMYVAKARSNSFQFYSADMNVRAAARLQLETDLRRAVEREEFLPHYQPLIDAHSGNICGVEALVRWSHPHRGLLSPDSFISVAEETGLIVPITELVLRAACAQTKAWQVGGFPGLHVAANISRRLFQHHNLSDMIVQILQETGLEPSSLEVELTESLFIQDRERSIATLRKLRDVGVRIAIDDFGVEYSSLGYLKHLPITTLKIDQSFVRDLPTNMADIAIIQAIISLASSLDLTVIAEGVETNAQAEFLRSRLCDGLQGYYFSRPLPANLLTPLLGHSVFRPARSRITLGQPEGW